MFWQSRHGYSRLWLVTLAKEAAAQILAPIGFCEILNPGSAVLKAILKGCEPKVRVPLVLLAGCEALVVL